MHAEIRRIDERHTRMEEVSKHDSDKQNEFRGSLDDLGKNMATRRETEGSFAAMSARVDDHQRQLSELRSRVDVGPAQLAQLQTRSDTQTGRQQGVGLSANVAATLIATLISFAALIAVVYIATH